MSYAFDEQTGDLVISGWEDGIKTSPHKGLANVQCADISTVPGEIMCNYGRIRQSQFKSITNSLNANSASTLTALAGSSTASGLLRGTWIHITSSSITNLTNGSYYYVESSVGGIITISTTFEGSIVNTLGVTGSATFDVIPMGKPIAWTASFARHYPDYYYFVLDNTGYVWAYDNSGTDATTWRMIAHNQADTVPNFNDVTGIIVYGNYLLAATDQLYYKQLNTDSQLGTAWGTFASSTTFSGSRGNTLPQNCILGNDQVVYITNDQYLASLTVVAGSDPTAFNPTSGATYTFTATALTLPQTQVATCVAELGVNLIIGTQSANLYTWNRTPISIGGGNTLNSFFFPIFLPERYTYAILTVNNYAMIFGGSSGNIYITNGSTVSPILKVPDYVTQQIEPFYSWGGTMYLRGRVWFSIKDSNSKIGGVWSFVPQQNFYIEQDTGSSLRLEVQNTYGTYAGMATLIFPSLAYNGQQARGPQYWAAWDDGTSGASVNPYGIDYSDTSPFTAGQTVFETDAIPIGTLYKKFTPKQIEYKLSTALVSGESVQLYIRKDLNASYTSLGTAAQEASLPLSGVYKTTLQGTQWVQFKGVLTSTATNPSFVRLKELRLRK